MDKDDFKLSIIAGMMGGLISGLFFFYMGFFNNSTIGVIVAVTVSILILIVFLKIVDFSSRKKNETK